VAPRRQNEKRFGNWEDLPGGGRQYWSDRLGAVSGFQRMIKVVDADEVTLQVIQEIYNEEGVLVERHQKYPVDTGHQRFDSED